jgi:hypothetical protein
MPKALSRQPRSTDDRIKTGRTDADEAKADEAEADETEADEAEADEAETTDTMTGEVEIGVDRAETIIEESGIEGFNGDCGEAAKAIGEVIFDGRGEMAFAINPHHRGLDEWIGHAAWKGPKGRFWDATGRISKEELRKWGHLPYTGPDADLSDEKRYDGAEVLCLRPDEESLTRNLFFVEPARTKKEKLREAKQKGVESSS